MYNNLKLYCVKYYSSMTTYSHVNRKKTKTLFSLRKLQEPRESFDNSASEEELQTPKFEPLQSLGSYVLQTIQHFSKTNVTVMTPHLISPVWYILRTSIKTSNVRNSFIMFLCWKPLAMQKPKMSKRSFRRHGHTWIVQLGGFHCIRSWSWQKIANSCCCEKAHRQ